MSTLKHVRTRNSITVRSDYWEVVHDLKAGGCWSSVTFVNGSGKNLLAGPVSGRVRNLDPHPTTDAASPYFYEEKCETKPAVKVDVLPSGAIAITAEGMLRLSTGEDIGIGYRHRYEYRDWGLVACELEFSCPKERNDIVEVVAMSMSLRDGMTDAYVRENPICSGHADLLGMGRWFRLGKGIQKCSSRYVPMHVVCFEKGVEGIEFTCESDHREWNTGFNPEVGLGYYGVHPSWTYPNSTEIELAPYCVAYRRNPTTLKGTHRVRYYLGLPFVKERATVHSPYVHAGADSHWLTDCDLEVLARSGVKLIRFHNDYRRDGPFWRDGMYPPYDEAGMAQLRRIIDTTHRLGMKIVPYISVKEFHPDTPGCKENQERWRQQPGPTFPELHTWYGSGEFGQLMCLESGWLEFRKKSIDIILNDLTWDGLYFDWCTPHNCRNPHHFGGAYHSDQDAFYDFMAWVRQRIGPDGIFMNHLSGLPQIVVENMSTLAIIYEDQAYTSGFPEPPDFPPQCAFMPVVPRHLCAGGEPGTPEARKTLMAGILQGHPGFLTAYGVDTWDPNAQIMSSFSEAAFREMGWFAGEDLASYRLAPASDRAVATNQEKTYAAIWYKRGRALVYVGNFSERKVTGGMKVDLKGLGVVGKQRSVRVRSLSSGPAAKSASLSVAAVRGRGVGYRLGAWASALYVIEE